MNLHRIFLQLVPLALVSALPATPKQIQWGPCPEGITENSTLPLKCGTLAVPLDYTESNNTSKHTLELIKTPSQIPRSKGTIILNFGGPGVQGLNSFSTLSYRLRHISFNPRGTSDQYLRFSCYKSEEERLLATTPNPLFTFPNASDTALGKLWADGKLLADECYENAKDSGEFVGTAFTARDVMRVVDALEEGPLINFYDGINRMSYGTALGATIAAMFPERIGNMVLDGCLKPHEYWHTYVDPEMVTDADAALYAFLSECVEAGPPRCVLARNGATAESLEKTIYGLAQTVKYEPMPFPASMVRYDTVWGGSTIDYSSLKNMIAGTLYHPLFLLIMAAGLDGLLQGNWTAVAHWRDISDKSFGPGFEAEALQGIRCGDKYKRASEFEDVLPEMEQAADISWVGGNAAYDHSLFTMPCARWHFDAKERYMGDFLVKTYNPVLLVGSTYDPVTPLRSAHNISAGFEGSVVLERKGFGHVSASQRSACSDNTTRNYYSSGELPEPNTVCEPDNSIFGLDSPL